MKLVFDSFAGTKWAYDVTSAEIKPFKSGPKGICSRRGVRLFTDVHHISSEEISEALDVSRDTLVINTTDACSNRCRYCVFGGAYPNERTHGNNVISLEIAKKAVDDYLEHSRRGRRYITFYGGEPTFGLGMDRIRDIVTYANAKTNGRINYSMTTNGNHLSQENISFLVDNEFRLMVSLDGGSTEHDRYRVTASGQPTYARVMSSLSAIRSYDSKYYEDKVGFVCTLTPPLQYEQRSRFFAENELTRGHFVMVSHVSLFGQKIFSDIVVQQHVRDTIEMTNAAAKRYYEAACKNKLEDIPFERGLFDKDLSIIHARQEEEVTESLDLMGRCIPGSKKSCVTCDGKYFICEKFQSGYQLGDVDEGIIPKNVRVITSKCERLIEDKCTYCPYAKICTLCYISALDDKHQFNASRLEDNCAERRSFTKVVLRLYASIVEEMGDEFFDSLFG